MSYLFFSLQTNAPFLEALNEVNSAIVGDIKYRRFPDGESYVRILTNCKNKDVVILHCFHHPDADFLALVFLATALKQRGAKRIGLVAPYLAYMRQDKCFKEGELVTSQVFAGLISQHFDWLITVDPHLHRYKSLEAIYSIPCVTLHSAPILHNWIKKNIPKPLLIGPDSESAQWVEQAAKNYGLPFLVLEKQRRGDREVSICLPTMEKFKHHTPVLVDDIVSSGRTLLESIAHLQRLGFKEVSCVVIHGVFAEDSYERLCDTGASVVSANTIPHVSNLIDLNPLFIKAINQLTE